MPIGAELSAATWNVPPGGTLQSTINGAAEGDLILLQAGTYTTTEAFFYLRKALTVVGVGAASTVIQAPANAGVGIQVTASNVRVEGLRITPAQFGIIAGATGQTLTNVIVRDVLIDNATTAHGILFSGVALGFIQRCRVVTAYANGIMLDDFSSGNVVSNNTVQSTQTQHAIAIRNSDRNTVVNNVITGSGFHGIFLGGSQSNSIHLNNISGQAYDGITLTGNGLENQRLSTGNYVGQNTIAGNVVRTGGTGIRMTYGASGTYVFGNTQYGAVEAGISSFNADSNWIRGNVTSSNGQAGVLVWKFDQQLKRNEYTTVHNNLVYNQQNTNGILFRGAWFNEAAWNYISNSGAGLTFEGFAGASGESTLFENTVRDASIGLLIDSSNRSTRVYRNRFIGIAENYIFQGAEAVLDANKWLGGNYWSEHPSTQPYSRFITRTVPSVERSGAYVDRFPFAEETLGQNLNSQDTYSIWVDAPGAERVVAAGSRKTIRWRSKGCALVDLFYFIPRPGIPIPIVSNYPDHGFFQWTVPAVQPRNDYAILAACKNSAGTHLTASPGSPFRISTGDIRLLAPSPDIVLNSGQTIRVVWARSGAVPAVDVLYRASSAWIPIVTNVNDDSVLITVPNVGSPVVQFRVQASNNPSLADVTDGTVVIRAGPVGVYSSSEAIVYTRDAVNLAWVSPQGSTFVSIDLWDSQSQVFRPVTQNLPDFGWYRWLVPELYMTGGYLRYTFKNAEGVTMSVHNGGPLHIRYSSVIGARVPFYRLYSPAAGEHLYTTFRSEYDYLGANGWIQERTVGDIVNGSLTIGSPEAVPFYRLFDGNSGKHLWTTDRNEYFTLRELPNWTPENFAGYLFKTQFPGTIPFLRLIQQAPPYSHHWTSSACEHNYLRTVGWTSEGIVGYVYANADSDNNCTEQPVLSSASPVLTSGFPGVRQLLAQSAVSGSRVASGASIAGSAASVLILSSSGDLISSETPAEAGEIITILLNDVGLMDRTGPDGISALFVEINGIAAEILSAESSVESPEALQLRFRIPPGLPAGAAHVSIHSGNSSARQSMMIFLKGHQC